jgi:hypothetical protein
LHQSGDKFKRAEFGVSVKTASGMVSKNVMDVFGTPPSESGAASN